MLPLAGLVQAQEPPGLIAPPTAIPCFALYAEQDQTNSSPPEVNVEVCSGHGTSQVRCWEWNRAGEIRGCLSESGAYYKNGGHGVYYCPPPGESEWCDSIGKPSDGTIDVCANSRCDMGSPFFYSFVCYDGECSNGGNYKTNSRYFTHVYAQIVHRTGGTFGGWADAYPQVENPAH